MKRNEYRRQLKEKQAALDAKVVPVIRRMLARGASFYKVADTLIWVADPPSGFGKWSHTAVRRIAIRHGIKKVPAQKCDGRCEVCGRPCNGRDGDMGGCS